MHGTEWLVFPSSQLSGLAREVWPPPGLKRWETLTLEIGCCCLLEGSATAKREWVIEVELIQDQ